MGNKRLKPFYKRLFSFLAAGTFLGGGAIAVNNEKKNINERTESVVNTLETYKICFDKNNKFEITLPRDSSGEHHKENFDFKELVSQLESSVPIFYKYNSPIHFIKSDEEKKEYDNAMRAIYNSNIKFVELQNMKIKEEIAFPLQINPDKIDILYELSNVSSNGSVFISINGNSSYYELSDDLEDKIKSYKKAILITQGKNFDSLATYQKEDAVKEILNNISLSRKDIIDYCVNNNVQINDKTIAMVPDGSQNVNSEELEK